MTTLICPKCQGEWRQYERNGVTVDQCTDCRGIFLDRGELDRLIDAENSYYETEAAAREAAPNYPEQGQQPPGAPPSAPPPAPPSGTPPEYSPPPGQSAPPPYTPQPGGYPPPAQPGYGYPSHGGHYRKRKKSFLDELFD